MTHAFSAGAAGHAPCGHACPVDQNAKEYVALIAEGRFGDALEVIRRTNPFPSVCGRICPAPCEKECIRAGSGGPVAVRWLKRFVADLGAEEALDPVRSAPTRATRIAVVGGGPAGLAAALDLACLGHDVTVLEAKEEAGGMLRWVIPEAMIPRRIVRAEVRAALARGVRMRAGTRLGRDLSLDDILGEGYSAVLLAVGAWRQSTLGLPGEQALAGVSGAIDLLERGTDVRRGRVIVVGATRDGFRAACEASRMGARTTLVTPVDRDMLPVDRGIVEAAESSGVRIRTGLRPVEVRSRGGAFEALVTERIGGGGAVAISGSVLVAAVDRFVDPGTIAACAGVDRSPWGGILADPDTCETSRPGVFAAGDAATGPRTVIEAIAAGHRAAASIHRRLTGEEWRISGRPMPPTLGPEAFEIGAPVRARAPRLQPLEGAADALEEARRCLRCGLCLDCETCHPDCPTAVAVLVTPGSSRPAWSDPIVKIEREILPGVLEAAFVTAGGQEPRRLVLPVPSVDEGRCLGCARCVDACPYEVIRIAVAPDGAGVARLHAEACRACGTCAGVCPTGAIDQPHWTHEAIDRALDRPGEDLVLACRWAAGGGHGAIPLPCAGRAGERALVRASASGARSVTVLDCGGACRYRSAAGSHLSSASRVQDLLARLGLPSGPPLRGDGIPLDVPAAGSGKRSAPFGEVLGDVDRLLASAEFVPDRGCVAAQGLRVADRAEIALSTGCIPFVDALAGGDLRPSLLEGVRSAIRLLNRASIVPALLDDERACCAGIAAGDETSRRLAALNAEAFERAGARTILATCGEAVRALRMQAMAAGMDAVRIEHVAVFMDRERMAPERTGRGREGIAVAVLDDPADTGMRRAAERLLGASGLRPVSWRPRRPGGALGGGGRAAAVGILGHAREAGAAIVATTSVRRSLAVRYALRRGSWDTFGVTASDLMSLLGGSST